MDGGPGWSLVLHVSNVSYRGDLNEPQAVIIDSGSRPPVSPVPCLSSDMLLLRTSSLLALLCLLPSGQVLHQHAGHVHPLPHHELRRVLPHAVPHRLRARQGERERRTTPQQHKIR